MFLSNTALKSRLAEIDLEIRSPLMMRKIEFMDFAKDSNLVARNVNRVLAIKEGGSIRMAMGKVLYEKEQNERREKVLAIKPEFYAE